MSCYERYFRYKRMFRMPERSYWFTHTGVLMRYPVNSIRTRASLTKHFQRSLLSEPGYPLPSCFGSHSFQSCICFGKLQPNGESLPGSATPTGALVTEGALTCQKQLVEATSRMLDVPRSRMCMISLGGDHPWELAEYGGVRVIM